MRRSDKQADRVEISPEQLSAAAIKAEVSTPCLCYQSATVFRSYGWSATVFGVVPYNFVLVASFFLDVYLQQLAANLKRPIQVLGWYHSHPHITVWPSHVGKTIVFVAIPTSSPDWFLGTAVILSPGIYIYIQT